jgi:hypothetical protein
MKRTIMTSPPEVVVATRWSAHAATIHRAAAIPCREAHARRSCAHARNADAGCTNANSWRHSDTRCADTNARYDTGTGCTNADGRDRAHDTANWITGTGAIDRRLGGRGRQQ